MTSPFRSKKEVIYNQLRDSIIDGTYKPGARLVIDELVTQVKASQIPIREALQQLEADGFVTIEPYVGARIAEIDATFIFEVFGLLEATEIISSRAACRLMTDDDLQTLTSMIAEMDLSVHDADRWGVKNREMHLYICERAQMSLVLQTMKKIFAHWERLRRHYLEDVSTDRIVSAQKEHKELLKAFQERDPQKVERIIREHNQSALQDYIQHLRVEGHLATIES